MQIIDCYSYIKIIILHSLVLFFINLIPSQAWSSDKKLKVGVSQYEPPISFIEENEMTPKGFSVDLANLLADTLGLEAEVYAIANSELIPALNDGKIDMVIGVMDDSYSTTNMIKTTVQANRNYYINRQCLTFTSFKDLPGHTVAIEKGRTLTSLLLSQTNINFIETESQEEALALVDSMKAQVYISMDSGATQYILEKKGFNNIKEVGMPIEIVPLVLAVNKGDPELLTSLSIAYGKILEDGRYHGIFYRWLGNDIKFIFLGKYRKYIIGVGLVAIFGLLLSIIWSFVLKKKVNHITKDLQISEQRYRDLIETSPEMIHLISMRGEIRLANKIALTHLGYNETEMKSIRLHDLMLPEQKEDVTSFIDSVFRHKYSNEEFIFKTKSGNCIHVEMVATIVKGTDNEAELVCCFARDITERKRLEENLIHSDRLAIMGQMAAGIAHEINNPLGIIMSNAQDMLYHELKADDSQESLKSIERNALRAAKIIEDLLSFTRPRLQEIEPVDLIQLSDESLLFFKQRLRQKNIKIVKSYASDLISLSGDRKLIQQLLINLILNAIHAIKTEGVITLRIEMAGEGVDRKLILKVEDNGIGIPQEDLKKIFDPFFTSRKEDGFGLGLFISKIIVEKHHGNLSVSSNVGKGTVMTVEFPIEAIKIFPYYDIVN
jgi:PAS domain S-box-containing protein